MQVRVISGAVLCSTVCFKTGGRMVGKFQDGGVGGREVVVALCE